VVSAAVPAACVIGLTVFPFDDQRFVAEGGCAPGDHREDFLRETTVSSPRSSVSWSIDGKIRDGIFGFTDRIRHVHPEFPQPRSQCDTIGTVSAKRSAQRGDQ
jgi:hypothetical protein